MNSEGTRVERYRRDRPAMTIASIFDHVCMLSSDPLLVARDTSLQTVLQATWMLSLVSGMHIIGFGALPTDHQLVTSILQDKDFCVQWCGEWFDTFFACNNGLDASFILHCRTDNGLEANEARK